MSLETRVDTWLPKRWCFVALIVVATAAAYSNSLRGPFIFDDTANIVDNRSIRRLWPLSDVIVVRSATEVGLHSRPVAHVTFAINHAMGGLKTLPYHVTNLLIHLLAALTLFGVVRRTLALEGIPERLSRRATVLALAVTLLWALHPLQTQAVTYVVQRFESLMGLFFLAALYSLIRAATSSRGRGWAAACVAATALAMGSKEPAVAAPLCLLLYDRAFLAGSLREAWARRWGTYLGLAATWIGFAVLQALASSRGKWAGYGLPYSWHEYALSQFGVILHYLQLSLWPRPLVLDYGWPLAKDAGAILPAALVVTGLAVASALALVRRPKLGFPGAWFFLILAPTSSVLPLADLAFLHRMYLPSAAVAVAVVLGGETAIDAAVRRGWIGARAAARSALGVLTAAAVVLAVGTWHRNRDYGSAVSIWRDTVAKAPRNSRAHYSLGAALAESGQPQEAIAELRKALEINPGLAQAYNSLGVVLAAYGQADEAIAHFRKALELSPDSAQGHNNLGFILAGRGQTEEAIAHFRKALRIKPDMALAHNSLGVALLARGEAQEAIAHFRKALESRPDYAEARNNLRSALAAGTR